ncbi:CaiB/BaiF CoA transferase family protein [Chloroflexota bacterium]
MGQKKATPQLLDRYRVLDLTDEKGFLCGRLLADLGADVIKIESPGGDPGRSIGPFYKDILDPDKSLFWFGYNSNKRGITLDIESSKGQELLQRLIKDTDFVIESFAPGYLDSLGLGYQALSEINHRIIMTSITPFGQNGPYSAYKASDLIITSMGGYIYLCGDEDQPPVRFNSNQSYFQGSAQAAVGTLIAHYHREHTGEGQHIDVSMQESMVWALCYATQDWFMLKSQQNTRSDGVWKRFNVAYRVVFPCKDGYVCYRVLTGPGALSKGTKKLVESMNADGLGEDMKDIKWEMINFYDVKQSDIEHWEKAMCEYFAGHTKQELYEEAVRQGNMLQPVNTTKDITESSQLAARDFWVQVEHPELGTSITYPGPWFKSTEATWQSQCRAPLLGEHNEEVYRKYLGLSHEEMNVLKRDHII